MDTPAKSTLVARQGVNLSLALWVSVINFWAWNLVGPLSTTYAAQMRLSSTEASVLVATPILVGSLGRLVTGPLTDRFGGRILFIAVCVASILPVLAVGRRDRTLLSVAARVRLLSGCSRHGLRGRDPVCKQSVRTVPCRRWRPPRQFGDRRAGGPGGTGP